MKSEPNVIPIVDILREKIKQLSLEVQKIEEENKTLLNLLQYKTLQIARYNDLMKELIKKLVVIHDAIPEKKMGCREHIENCLYELKQYQNQGIWDEFKMRFAEVHTDFYDKLIGCHPTLTENDLRLCAFIKLKMSTKEIAAVTNHPVNSVKVSRKRLRKKLQLEDSSTSLINVLALY
jgi:hypothetical protein